MRLAVTLKVVAFNGSSETFTFAGSGRIDRIADFERGNIDFIARSRSEERREGKSVDLGGRRIIKKKK